MASPMTDPGHEVPPNTVFETEFELDPKAGSTLSKTIRHQEREVNRVKITSDRIRNTSFRAELAKVQYGTYNCQQADGTYKPEPAALLIFNFRFHFRSENRDRFTSVKIEVEFKETLNTKLERPPDRNPNNDPQVRFVAPHQICGTPTEVDVKKSWKFEGQLGYQVPAGPSLSATPSVQTEASFQRHHRMWIKGDTDGDNDHRWDNKAVWVMQENRMQGSGVLSSFPGAVVIVLPKSPEHLVKARVTVVPHLAFSLNPLRLKQKRDDPILLDRKTSWGPEYEPGKDFSDPDYPWSSIIKIPTEYQDILHT
ncbi:hypothetical protein QBC33DRAFT_548237 [Phialemonium atrogriseum]|uniref:Uncharacterized protein n=1 Tax=Phialemonium atrogriseum TaxID=1093897 RepID=A0AAJ0FEB4_9PEZI|nr:uncharacterized protein QBC33DRAFT_548237 [Phialemonium atrogriseum]KAK1764157.1 hypothetical protein QBC33DRAFT_548237 [Phialemonium atrogriseum]